MRKIYSRDIVFSKPPVDEFLGEYNHLLATLLVEAYPSFQVISSATINRLEGQTHFFEKVEKYIQIRNVLQSSPDAQLVLEKNDTNLFEPLRQEFGNKVLSEQKPVGKIARRLKFFLYSWPGRLAITLIFNAAAKFLEKPTKKKYTHVIRTYFDWRCLDDDLTLREEYFGPFTDDLGKTGKLLVVFKLVAQDFRSLKAYFAARRNGAWDNLLLDSFLSPLSILKAFGLFLRSGVKVKKPVYYKNVNISKLLQDSLDDDYFSLRGLTVYLERAAAREILLLRPQKLLFPYENQTWEKIYPFVRQKYGFETAIIGFQHTGLSYKLLNYFPCHVEKPLPLFPDKIITVGKVFQRLLIEKAAYPCPIEVGGALRHYRWMVNGEIQIKKKNNIVSERGIVYAFSYDRQKYQKILDVLIHAFKDSNLKIYLKFHPDYDQNKILGSLNGSLPSNFIPSRDISWPDIYRRVCAVLYDDNSIGIEGMINGIITYHLDIEEIYHCERLFYFDSWETSIDVKGLESLEEDLCHNDSDSLFDFDAVSYYVKEYYSSYDSNYFLELIDK